MTLRKAKSIARHLRLTLRQVCSGDYRVNFRDGDETTAYYTDSLEDAINTAVGMARRREAAPYRVGDVIQHLPSWPKPSQSRSPPDDAMEPKSHVNFERLQRTGRTMH